LRNNGLRLVVTDVSTEKQDLYHHHVWMQNLVFYCRGGKEVEGG
jgi:hypothetical protein